MQIVKHFYISCSPCSSCSAKFEKEIFFWDILAVAKLLVSELFYTVLGCLRRERDDEFEPYTDNSDLWVYKVK